MVQLLPQTVLKNKGIRLTDVRIKLLTALKENPNKTYSEIFRLMKSESPSLSMTSVYNNIELFKKKKVI